MKDVVKNKARGFWNLRTAKYLIYEKVKPSYCLHQQK